jgi:hypothetical protein
MKYVYGDMVYWILESVLFHILLYFVVLIFFLSVIGNWQSCFNCSSFMTLAERNVSGSFEESPTGQ